MDEINPIASHTSIVEDAEDKDSEFRRIIAEIQNKQIIYRDWKDYSNYPSYTNFEVPYHMKCRDRYVEKRKLYDRQFLHEIEQLLQQQGNAYEAARLNRHLCITSLWPPLHNRHEIQHVQRNFFRLTRKQRQRLNIIMNTNII